MNLFPMLVALCLSACLEPAPEDLSGIWSGPQSEVLDGGPGKDGIPAVDNPQFYQNASELAMADDELVVAFYRKYCRKASMLLASIGLCEDVL